MSLEPGSKQKGEWAGEAADRCLRGALLALGGLCEVLDEVELLVQRKPLGRGRREGLLDLVGRCSTHPIHLLVVARLELLVLGTDVRMFRLQQGVIGDERVALGEHHL